MLFPSREIYGWDAIISCNHVTLRESHLVLLNTTRCFLNYNIFRILYLKSRAASTQVPPESETFWEFPALDHTTAQLLLERGAELVHVLQEPNIARAKEWTDTPFGSHCSYTPHQQGYPPSIPRCQGEQSVVVNLGTSNRKANPKSM